MSAQGKWKLVAVLIIASAILGAAGWQQLAPKPSLPTNVMITPTVTTVSGTQKTVVPTGSVNYYLSLLESNGTQPYVQLAKELRKLPDLTNATAVATITYLALNATNPEVKEAFELMIKGGTPDPRDYQYQAPNYNTELQVLYWLACQNEFKKDDTLVLAVAMTNGLWITIGDSQVRNSILNDTTQLLRFLRETNEVQLRKGFFALEDYPLEAKICLASTSSIGTIDGPHSVSKLAARRADQKSYRWVRCDVDTLLKMRDIAFDKGWIERSVDLTVKNLEEYFYFSGAKQHWTYSTRTGDIPGVTESLIEVEGELIPDHSIYNLRFYLDRYLKTERGIGDCGDETYLMEAWCKSWGIATNFVLHQIIVDGTYYGHVHMIYYDPATKTWKAYQKQLADQMYHNKSDLPFYVFVFKPPVKQTGYFAFTPIPDSRMGTEGTVYVTRNTPVEFRRIYQDGCSTSQMKQWLLYS